MAHREGWRESKVRVGADLYQRLVEISIAKGWSLDTCARRAMISRARKAGRSLRGGGQSEVRRRDPETLRSGASDMVWITFPEAWKEELDALVEEHPIHRHQAAIWREAILSWVERQEKRQKKAAEREAA